MRLKKAPVHIRCGALNPNDWSKSDDPSDWLAAGFCDGRQAAGARAPRWGPRVKRAGISSSRLHNSSREPAVAPAFAGPDRLVGLGFRNWLEGYRTGDITLWENVWCAYTSAMGAVAAKSAVSELSSWVRAIHTHTHRALQTSPPGCPGFCKDECVAISMIAACQHNACPAMRACAFALLGCSMIDEVVHGAESFAGSMRDADQVLSPGHACRLPLLSGMPAATAMRH